MSSAKRMTTPFRFVDHRSPSREISRMSRCLVITQYPPSSKTVLPSGCSFHQTGAVWRNCANSATGMPSWMRSGSVKSKPEGRSEATREWGSAPNGHTLAVVMVYLAVVVI